MAALQPRLSKSFKFSPSASAELFLKPHNTRDASPDGHSFNFLDVLNYLKNALKISPHFICPPGAYDGAFKMSSCRGKDNRQALHQSFCGGESTIVPTSPAFPNAGFPPMTSVVKGYASQIIFFPFSNFIFFYIKGVSLKKYPKKYKFSWGGVWRGFKKCLQRGPKKKGAPREPVRPG